MVPHSKGMLLGPYSQHFIFFVTYDRTNKIVLHYAKLERIARDKHSSLLGQFIGD